MRWKFVVLAFFLLSIALGQEIRSQYSDLVAVPDGSALYFTTPLPPKGSSLRTAGRIYRVVADGLQLVVDVPATDLSSTDPWRETQSLARPILNRDGHLIGWTKVDTCGNFPNYICASQVAFRTSLELDRTNYLIGQGRIPLAIESSPSGNFLLTRRDFGLGTVSVNILWRDRPTEPQACSLERSRISPALVTDNGECLSASQLPGELQVFRYPAQRLQSFPAKPFAVSYTAVPEQSKVLVLEDESPRHQTRLWALEFSETQVAQNLLATQDRLSCTEVKATRGNRAILRCRDANPFWLWDGLAATLTPLPLKALNVLTWTAALDGYHVWFVDRHHRIARYEISTDTVSHWSESLETIQAASNYLPGAWVDFRGTGFDADNLPVVEVEGQPLALQYRNRNLLIGRWPEQLDPDSSSHVRYVSRASNQPFEAPPSLRIPFSSSTFAGFGNGDYLTMEYQIPLAIHEAFDGIVQQECPAVPGEIVHFYIAGAPPADLACFLDTEKMPLHYLGPAPGFLGLTQLSIGIPATTPTKIATLACSGQNRIQPLGQLPVRVLD